MYLLRSFPDPKAVFLFFLFFIFMFEIYMNIPGRPAAGRPGPGRPAAGRQGHLCKNFCSNNCAQVPGAGRPAAGRPGPQAAQLQGDWLSHPYIRVGWSPTPHLHH